MLLGEGISQCSMDYRLGIGWNVGGELTANSTSLFLRTDIVGKGILVILLEAGTRSAQVHRVPF
jgi:hypothetical protein